MLPVPERGLFEKEYRSGGADGSLLIVRFGGLCVIGDHETAFEHSDSAVDVVVVAGDGQTSASFLDKSDFVAVGSRDFSCQSSVCILFTDNIIRRGRTFPVVPVKFAAFLGIELTDAYAAGS